MRGRGCTSLRAAAAARVAAPRRARRARGPRRGRGTRPAPGCARRASASPRRARSRPRPGRAAAVQRRRRHRLRWVESAVGHAFLRSGRSSPDVFSLFCAGSSLRLSSSVPRGFRTQTLQPALRMVVLNDACDLKSVASSAETVNSPTIMLLQMSCYTVSNSVSLLPPPCRFKR